MMLASGLSVSHAADPSSDAALYNQGVVLYRSGEFAKAAELFKQAAASENLRIAASARFNLGNAAYAQALETLEQDPARAAEDLERAIKSYRETLSLHPADEDARMNIELAVQLLQQLQSKQEQGSSNEGQEEDQQSPSESRPEGDQRNEDAGDEGDREPMQEQPTEEQPSDSGETQESSETEDSAEAPEESGSASESSNDSETPGQPSPGETTPSNEPEQRSSDPLSQGENGSGSADAPSAMAESDDLPNEDDARQNRSDAQQPDLPAQDEPIEEQDPAGQLATANEDDERTEGGVAGQEAIEGTATMTFEEAQKMLQAIRDRDFLRRLRRQQIERSRRVPVEKDW